MAAPHNHHSPASGAFAASPGSSKASTTSARLGEAQDFFRDVVLTFEDDSCLTWPYSKTRSGYGRISIRDRSCLVHRLACEAEHGPPPSEHHVAAHSCGRGAFGCVSRKHVRWATSAENYADAVRHGTAVIPTGPRARGEQVGGARLTEIEVQQLRLCKGHISGRRAAALFGVAGSTVFALWRGKTWRHV